MPWKWFSLLVFLLFVPKSSGQSFRIGPVYSSGDRVEAQITFDSPQQLPDKRRVWLIEDGVATVSASEIKIARDARKGLAAILAVDLSGSMRGQPLKDLQTALADHITELATGDSVALVSFADQPKLESGFDSPQSTQLQSTIQSMKARGRQTRLYDALSYCLDLMDKVPAKRRELIVISDGISDGSRIDSDSVTQRARALGVTINALGRGKYSPDSSNSLYRLTRESGGLLAYAGPGEMSEKLKLLIGEIESMPVAIFERKLDPSGAKTKKLAIQFTPDGSAPEVSREIEMAIPLSLVQVKPSPFPWVMVIGALILIIAIAIYLWRRRERGKEEDVVEQDKARELTPAKVPELPVQPSHRRRETEYDSSIKSDVKKDRAAFITSISLEVIAGPLAGKRVVVPSRPFRIGAAPDNSLSIAEDDYVSGHHAQIDPADGGFVIKDVGSRGGTFVNGNRITGVCPISSGDVIRLGKSEFQVSAAKGASVDTIR